MTLQFTKGERYVPNLVVEDDASIAHVLRDSLVFEGFSVKCVNDGREVFSHFQRFHPHLVLLDLTLPGVDGWSVQNPQRAQ